MPKSKPRRTIIDQALVELIRDLLGDEGSLWLTPDPAGKPSDPQWWTRFGMTKRERDEAIVVLMQDVGYYLATSEQGLRLIKRKVDWGEEWEKDIARAMQREGNER